MAGQSGAAKAALGGRLWYAANEVLAFLLELAALGLLCWWGFATGGGVVVRVLLGLGAPLPAAVLWGLFAAPKARLRPPLPAVLLVKAVVFGAGAAALSGVGHPVAAVVVAAVMLANTAVAETFRRSPSRRALGLGGDLADHG
ncbi:YrdB family protein [Saccharothrix sp. ST-888]|uniref:YrdB family protein n=1 Tax=Saccharothrix sp. ST-888 TaxID=1427391 RepID=UPI0009E4DF72|nr:YrdB family protein [Saccharothrix sp. ST-888]